jgi:hypothetical protein
VPWCENKSEEMMGWLKNIRERPRERQEVERARLEGYEQGLRFRAAKRLVDLLDSRLALAMIYGDQKRAEEIMPHLRIALAEYQKLLAEEAAENQRISVFLSSVKESK